MKKLLAIIMACLTAVACCFALTACGDKDVTLIVYTNAGFAPFEYIDDDGNVVGVDIDIMNKIGEELGYKVIINDISFKQIMPNVQAYKYAIGAAGMSKTDERDKVAIASDVYATSTQYVIAPNGTFTNNAVVSLDQIAAVAAKVGVQAGTTGQFTMEDYLAKNEELTNKIFEYENAVVASQDIGSAVDVVIIDELPANMIANSKNTLSCWKIDIEPEEYVLYFNKEASDLVKDVNKVIKKLLADGTVDQLIVKHSSGK
jgi:polar amino acid transport system substrate-binding protein